jgi:hypothetical protein
MVRLIKMLVVSLIPVCASGAARADDYEDGLAAARRGDYATAFKLLGPLWHKRDMQQRSVLLVSCMTVFKTTRRLQRIKDLLKRSLILVSIAQDYNRILRDREIANELS